MHVVDAEEMPAGQRPLPYRVVFDIKFNNKTHQAYKCKARVVAKGFMEVPGRDFFDVYSAVVNVKAFRLCLAILCLSPDHCAEQWDITAAFLHAMMEEKIYLELTSDDLERYFDIPKSQSSKKRYLLKLIKCLYGLMQSYREWYQLLRKLLVDCGCVPIVKDDCLYVKGC